MSPSPNPAPLFHLAFPSHDLDAAWRFYIEGLGCQPGRRNPHALIFGLGPHQLVAHKTAKAPEPQHGIYPSHFGLIFPQLTDWEALQTRATQHRLSFYRDATRRFTGTELEHHSFFLVDPSNNLLEFKYYCQTEAILGMQSQSHIGEST